VTISSPRRARAAAGWLAAAIGLGGVLAMAVATSAVGAAASPSGRATPLNRIERAIRAEEHETFKVTYLTHGGGTTLRLVFEQRPPDLRYGTPQGFILVTGGTTYFCSTTASPPVCASSGTNPFSALAAVFSPRIVATGLRALRSEVASKLAGVKATSSRRRIAGQASTCVTVGTTSASYTYCVTNAKGILAYSGSPAGYAQMTSVSISPPASDFSLPKGALVTNA